MNWFIKLNGLEDEVFGPCKAEHARMVLRAKGWRPTDASPYYEFTRGENETASLSQLKSLDDLP